MPHRCRHTSGRTRVITLWTGRKVTAEDRRGWEVQGTCEYGGCVELCCPVCGANKYGGWGSVMCPCDDWIPNHDERRKKPVAIKPSLRTTGVRRRTSRRVK